MAESDLDVPRTEQGLQHVLRRLEECRASGDLIETGNGLLELSYLVKCVRSDTEASPFVRSQELALQAVDVFRRAQHREGLVRSLVASSGLADKRSRDAMLAEAHAIAGDLQDENLLATVISGRARAVAMSDRARATELHREALEIYRRTENRQGIARCLFSLAIGEDSAAQKRDYAIEAARISRALGNHREASHCLWLAVMNAEEIQPLVELEHLVREGLNDAQNAGNRSDERSFYEKLALIASERGQLEEALKYRQWAKDLLESDGLTPLERWKRDVEMTKLIISISKAQGHKEAVTAFQEELKHLKASKPKK